MKMPAIPFSRANALAKAVNASNKNIGRGNVIRGIPGFPGGIQLGNMPAGLSDYINSPGTPGSSTFYLYGLSADDASSDVTTTSSPSFASALQSIVQSVSSAVPAVANAVTQITAQKTAQAQLQAGAISPTQYAQMTGQLPPSSGFPALTTSRAGAMAIPLIAVAALGAFLLMRKR